MLLLLLSRSTQYNCTAHVYYVYTTHNNVWKTGYEISKRLDHLIPALGRLEVLTRFPVALLDPLDPKAQRGCRRDRLPPNHVPVREKKTRETIKIRTSTQ